MRRIFLLVSVLFFGMSITVHAGWKFVSPMPHGRYYHDATLGQDGKIYVMGGIVFEVTGKKIIKKYNDGRYSSLVYDSLEDRWRSLEAVPGYIMPSRFLVFDNKSGEWKYKRKKSVFNRETKESCYELPDEYKNYIDKIRYTDFKRQGNGVEVLTISDGVILWIGGKDFVGRALDIVLSYDPVGKEWTRVSYEEIKTGPGYDYNPIYHTKIPRMHEQRCYHEAVMTSDGKIYVLGGGTLKYVRKEGGGQDIDDVYSNTMECYDPKSNTWEYKAPYKTSIIRFAAIVGTDNKIYVFGGGTYDKASNTFLVVDDVEVYDPKKDVWTSRKPMPGQRCGHAGVLGSDGMMYIMGGCVFRGPPLRDVWIYDSIKDSWREGPRMQVPRSSLAAVSTPDGKIYAIGGTDVGAYKNRETINFFLPKKVEIYKGKVQDTVEVLDISEL